MRRSIARGRLVPQSRSTDPRVGRVSLKAAILCDRMWINADDQGRLSGDPDEIKYTACPNLPEISKEDIPELLKELETQGLIKVFSTSGHTATQMLDWWEEQKLQWAYPSPYTPPLGWTDHLRYHSTPKEIITENWPPSGLPSAPPNSPPSAPPNSPPNSPASTPPSTPASTPASTFQPDRESTKEIKEKEKEKEEEKERGKGRLPSTLPSTLPSPSPSLTTNHQIILRCLIKNFRHEWGRVPADAPDTVEEKEPKAKELAQLRDLGKELSKRGGVPLDYIKQAFGEAANYQKCHVSYVRKILLVWLAVDVDKGAEKVKA